MPLEFHSELSDELVRLEGPGFGLIFRKEGDRWTDAIRGPAAEVARMLVVPDGSLDPARVPHPVYQEVQLHGPACLLLTGLSFAHHFSAAVTMASDPDDPRVIGIDFDVADRCRSPVESLAATYVVDLDSGALDCADPARIAWAVDGGRLELIAGPGSSLTMAEAGRRATRVQVLATIEPGTFTQRLRYGWRRTTESGTSR